MFVLTKDCEILNLAQFIKIDDFWVSLKPAKKHYFV